MHKFSTYFCKLIELCRTIMIYLFSTELYLFTAFEVTFVMTLMKCHSGMFICTCHMNLFKIIYCKH